MTTSPHVDPDSSIVAIAEKYNAFAIMSDDTDFLFQQYSSKVVIVSGQHLNPETLDTEVYVPEALANCLGLKINRLPVFASLKGNDYVHFKKLNCLHQDLNQSWYRNDNVRSLAKYISMNNVENLEFLDDLAERIFGDSSKAHIIEESIESYHLSKEFFETPLGVFQVTQSISPRARTI